MAKSRSRKPSKGKKISRRKSSGSSSELTPGQKNLFSHFMTYYLHMSKKSKKSNKRSKSTKRSRK